MKKTVALLLFIMLISPLLPCTFVQGNNDITYIYVAPNGDDSYAGTEEKPLRTLEGARNKVRTLKTASMQPANGYVIYLRAGKYSLTKSFTLESEDSGAEGAPIVYSAYPGEKVQLTGSTDISEHTYQKVTDETVLARVIDETARENLYYTDLTQSELSLWGDIYYPGAYSYYFYNNYSGGSKPPVAPTAELYINGELQTVARYPNEGLTQISEVIDPGATPCKWTDIVQSEMSHGFKIRPVGERYLLWSSVAENEALLYGNWRYAWGDITVPLQSVNQTDGYIESAYPSWHGVWNRSLTDYMPQFYVFNLPEEIDIPGEYYLDRKIGRLYIYPKTDLNTATVEFSSTKDAALIAMSEAENITFRNIEMTKIRGNAIKMYRGKQNRIENCEISYTANTAVLIHGDSRHNTVENCYIHDTNGGITVGGGNTAELIPGDNVVSNCHIENFARITPNYNAAIALNTVGNQAIHNEIHGSNHLAITFTGNNHLIAYNNIYDVCRNTDDMGAIYAGRSWVDRGTTIRYNYIHDIVSNHRDHGVHGIYLDDRLCGLKMEGNVFKAIDGSGIFINGGRDNVASNNIFVDTLQDFWGLDLVYGDGGNESNEVTTLVNTLENAMGYCTNEYWQAAYPELQTLINEETLPERTSPKNNTIMNNISLCCGTPKFNSAFKSLVNYHHNVNTYDEVFYNDTIGDFRIINESVLTAIPDFKELPLTDMWLSISNDPMRFFDNFENETINEAPSNWEAKQNATVSVQEEDGNKFLRLKAEKTWKVGDLSESAVVSTKPKIVQLSLADRQESIVIKSSMRMGDLTGSKRGVFCISYPEELTGTAYTAYQLYNIRGNSDTTDTGYFTQVGGNAVAKEEESFNVLPNKWYDVVTVIDVSGKITSRFYSDNMLVATSVYDDIINNAQLGSLSEISNLTLRTVSQVYQYYVDLDNISVERVPTSILFADDFEKDVVGSSRLRCWNNLRSERADVVVLEENGNQFMRITATADGGGQGLAEERPLVSTKDKYVYVPIANSTEPICLEMDLRIPDAGGSRYTLRTSFPIDYTGSETETVDYELFDFRKTSDLPFGFNCIGAEGSVSRAFSATENVWYHVRVVIDTDGTVTYVLERDGIEVNRTAGSLAERQGVFNREIITNLSFMMVSSVKGKQMDVDNVQVYVGERQESLLSMQGTYQPENGKMMLQVTNKGSRQNAYAVGALYENCAGCYRLLHTTGFVPITIAAGCTSAYELDTYQTDIEDVVYKAFLFKDGLQPLLRNTVQFLEAD